MSNYYHLPVFGIDVAANFSVVTVLSPNGDIYKKNFKFEHNLDGFTKLLNLIQKVEEEFGDSPKLFCESTGIYHLTLLHYLKRNQKDIYVINPLISNSSRKSYIRTIKNDKFDSLSIAKICKFNNVKTSMELTEEFLHLRLLVREYYNLIDNRSNAVKAFVNSLYVYYPGFQNAFSDVCAKTSLTFISNYPTPESLIAANSDNVIQLLRKTSKSGLRWSIKKYHELLKIANEALILGLNTKVYAPRVKRFIETYNLYSKHLDELYSEIKDYIKQAAFGKQFHKDLILLSSFNGLGRMSAIALLSEIGSIQNFTKSQQLVAFFGVDPGVNQSGKFNGDRNKMSKRGTTLGRRILYAFALQCIRRNPNKTFVNKVLYDYYHQQLEPKKKKVKLVAVMNKLLRYIFSVLKNQKPYVMRDPKIHKRMFLENNARKKVAA